MRATSLRGLGALPARPGSNVLKPRAAIVRPDVSSVSAETQGQQDSTSRSTTSSPLKPKLIQALKDGQVSKTFSLYKDSGSLRSVDGELVQDLEHSTANHETHAPSMKQSLQSWFLPDGYPATVAPDYLPYQCWALPTHSERKGMAWGIAHVNKCHLASPFDSVKACFQPACHCMLSLLLAVLGSLCHALTTSSLLSAVGLGVGPAGTTAASAAIRCGVIAP